MPLVRRIRRSEDFRANRLPTMPESDDDFRRKILHRIVGFVRKRARRCCYVLHGVGSAEINSLRRNQKEIPFTVHVLQTVSFQDAFETAVPNDILKLNSMRFVRFEVQIKLRFLRELAKEII